ncbi:MAG: DUF4003 domain-containing protein [Bacillus sp. (in: Bacteria)]|nr:DUF4003 domain-containing protein [Bacillus sp. (in: firmicutes)]
MGQMAEQLVHDYGQIFGELKKKLRWQITDERTLMMVASLYLIKGKPFNLEEFLGVSEYIKKNVGLFSSLRSTQRFTIAAMLILRFENPEETFHVYLKVYDKLTEKGFKRGAFTYIAAISLLTGEQQKQSLDVMSDKAVEIYKGMKKSHMFLTGQRDYPLAVLLAQEEREVESLMNEIDYYYHNLSKKRFSKRKTTCNFLSHVLSLQVGEDCEVIMERCIRLMDKFQDGGKRIKPMYYPALGLLALLEDAEREINNVMKVNERLNGEKLFRWHKDMNFMMAINFVVKDKVEDKRLVSTGIQTTIETIMQAQQAAMVAAMAGAATVATSSGNN